MAMPIDAQGGHAAFLPFGLHDPARPAKLAAFHPNWRVMGLLACWGSISALGSIVTASLDCTVLRAQAALACAALSSTIVLVERWGADPERMGRGGILAALAGAVSACASLI